MNKEKAVSLLTKQLTLIDNLKTDSFEDMDFLRWKQQTEAAIKNIFPNDPAKLSEFQGIFFDAGKLKALSASSSSQERVSKNLDRARILLKIFLDEIKSYWKLAAPDNYVENIRYCFVDVSKLVNAISKSFSLDDLRQLCLDLNIDYEEMSGEAAGKSAKILATVNHLKQNRRIGNLIVYIGNIRPKTDWTEIIY